ncbi:dihydrolipoyl dehydrogenase family protein [Paraoerskovia marina]|uniref:dihydrolipoyl dehydrogenase family protein n=1 Tax=Paraoerskovia marina TaxID=545619 RepID=UPI00049244B5|nr:NAD(P)/FAD-dependent oxidoreductase [Paraoerskovia marina]
MESQTDEFDVVVIGAGPVGENVADRAARTGLSVAVVESELAGGECSYWACMPSKALLRPGAAVEAAESVVGVGDVPALDVRAILAHRDEVTHGWDDESQADWIADAGMTLVRGHGRIVAPRTVQVTSSALAEVDGARERTLVARHAVVVATGSVPVLPPVPGLETASPWGSREATSADEVPGSLVVLGGGVVGSEMATAYRDLGADVTLVTRSVLLGAMEPAAGEAVAAHLREMGVDVVLGAEATEVVRRDDGSVTLTYQSNGTTSSVTANQILVASGRVPRTGDVGLESLGIEAPRGLDVDPTGLVQEAEGHWLYGVGDAVAGITTTHQGKYQARVVGDVIAARHGDEQPAWGGPVPEPGAEPEPWTRYASTSDVVAQTQVVFTRPQVASVGLTEKQAQDAGMRVRAVSFALEDTAGGYLMGADFAGTATIVVDEDRRVLVGATFVGPEAGEMLHAATVAVVGAVPVERLWHAVPAYPTVSEVWLRLLETYGL